MWGRVICSMILVALANIVIPQIALFSPRLGAEQAAASSNNGNSLRDMVEY